MLSNACMATIDETRRANLALLREEAGGVKKLADLIGISEAQMSQWLRGSADSKSGKPRGMRQESARRIELAMKRPEGWLDVPQNPTSRGKFQVAHDVSYTGLDAPPITAWEVVVSMEKLPVIPSDLMVEVPDDALAARGLMKGERIWFKAHDSAEPRNVILIEANGRRYIRRFTESGRAEALDSAFDSFEPGQFKVVAVMHMRPSKSI